MPLDFPDSSLDVPSPVPSPDVPSPDVPSLAVRSTDVPRLSHRPGPARGGRSPGGSQGASRGGGWLICGVGGVALVICLLVALLGGRGAGPLSDRGGTGLGVADPARGTESAADVAARCAATGDETSPECRLLAVFEVTDAQWRDEFARRGWSFTPPGLAFFSTTAQTGCGPADATVGPFYCPVDQEIYLDLGFLADLQQRFGAAGDAAGAYVLAHEYGHHLQTLLGTEPAIRAAEQRNPSAAPRYAVAFELQADCYAGVGSFLTSSRPAEGTVPVLTPTDLAAAVNAAQAVGSERVRTAAQGRVTPETWAYGSPAERQQWFLIGEQSGNLDSCNTFA